MPIVQFTRFKTDKAEEMVKIVRQAKTIFEKHGAEFLRLSRFHTGPWAGELLVATRYSSWEVYGKVQEAVAKDPEFAQVQAPDGKTAPKTMVVTLQRASGKRDGQTVEGRWIIMSIQQQGAAAPQTN